MSRAVALVLLLGCAHAQNVPVLVEVKTTQSGPVQSHERLEADDATVQRALQGAIPALNACYEAALKAEPELEGQVTLSFRVDAGGHAREVVAEGIGTTALHACLADVVLHTTFGTPYDHLAITVTAAQLSFRPVKHIVIVGQ
jgi:hypothetical protein